MPPGPSKLSFAVISLPKSWFHLFYFTALGRHPGARPLKDLLMENSCVLPCQGTVAAYGVIKLLPNVIRWTLWNTGIACYLLLTKWLLRQVFAFLIKLRPAWEWQHHARLPIGLHHPKRMHCHPPLLSKIWFLNTHICFQGFEMRFMHENSSWKYRDESTVFLQDICTLWLCFINSIWPGFQFQNKTKILLWAPPSPSPYQDVCFKASSFTMQK